MHFLQTELFRIFTRKEPTNLTSGKVRETSEFH